MGTPWDRAAAGYTEQWVPRFVPYHLDLIRELTLKEGDRVLVTSAGPGAEVLAVARAVGETGFIRATDKSTEMVRICREQIFAAGFRTRIECAVADAADTTGRPWDAIVCAFGLWQLKERVDVLRQWRAALAPNGKIGIITWGPSDNDQPFERLHACLRALEPQVSIPATHIDASREAMVSMFQQAGLEMVRHTVVRHTLSFVTGEEFVRALKEACTWRRIWEELGEARLGQIAAKFYESTGGPDAPLTFDPPATLAIASHPSAELELAGRPVIRPSKPPPAA